MVPSPLLRLLAALLPVLGIALLSPARSSADAPGFSAAVDARFDWWVAKQREWSHWPKPEDWGADDIEEGFAGPGLMLGPRLSYGWPRLRVTGGVLLSSDRDFDVTVHTDRVEPIMEPGRTSGRATRRLASLDVRYGTQAVAILGFRRLDVTVAEWPSGQVRSHHTSDVVVGFGLERPVGPRWALAFEGAFGVTGLRYAFSREAAAEHVSTGEASLDARYAPGSTPVSLRFGYGVWVFIAPDRVHDLGFAGRHWGQWVDIAHGARLSVAWAP